MCVEMIVLYYRVNWLLPPVIIFFILPSCKIYFFDLSLFADMADKKNRITDLKNTLFKSVEQNNRFKKCVQGGKSKK